MKTRFFLVATALIFVSFASAQVEKQVVLEHFTNTKCSVCASSSKNPALNANLQNHPNVIRISFHPSSPYSTCVFNQHNVSGNDDRTNQYGIYGATPRLVIQGEVISPNQDFSDVNLFPGYYGELSPVLLNLFIDSVTVDSTYVRLVATTVSSLTSIDALLYVGLAEGTINYNAPNGETVHHNVFRTAMNENQGSPLSLATTVGDSVVQTFSTKNHVDWNLNDLVAIGILQNTSDLSVIQSGISGVTQINNSSVTEQEGDEGFDVHFNASSNQLTILKENCRNYNNYQIISIAGQVVKEGALTDQLSYVELSKLTSGVYLVRLLNQESQTSSKALKFIK